MKLSYTTGLIVVAALWPALAAQGQAAPADPAAPDETVTITVSTQGLGQSAAEFSEAVRGLERLLEQIHSSEIALPEAELQKLDELIQSSTVLVRAIGDNAGQISTAIENAEAPVLALSSKVIDKAEQRLVTPTLEGLNAAVDSLGKTVKYALIVGGLLLLLVLIYVAVAAYFLNLRLRSVFVGMGKIIDGHVIVPRNSWEAATAVSTKPG